ncbi:MAG: zinc ribbon domain-containing protein [Acidobacteria bacterium]|nr:zinc ribbon domain-containing protein [Acidobacteriota bacterium]
MKLSAAALHSQCPPKCPQCAKPVVLRAPDHSERVVCKNCFALSEVRSGVPRELKLLRELNEAPAAPPNLLPLGATGKLDDVDYVVTSHLRRKLRWCQETREQDEYWLFNQETGFRRLLHCENHWSLAEQLNDDETEFYMSQVRCRGLSLELFDECFAHNEFMVGEFARLAGAASPRKTALFIRPPFLLFCTPHKDRKLGKKQPDHEWWLAKYLEPQVIKRAFGLTDLAEPQNIAPNQPFPYRATYFYGAGLAALLFAIWMFALIRSDERVIYSQTMQLNPVTGSEETQVFFTEPFDLAPRKNLKVTARAPVNNSWAYVEGDLINEATGLVYSFALPVEYYDGYEGSEYWSEGGTATETHLSALPPGKYTMRIEVQWEHWAAPFSATVELQQGIPRFWHFFWALLAVAAIPLLVGLHQHSVYEPDRWKGSPFLPHRYKPKDDD